MPNLQKGLVAHWSMNSKDTDNGKVRDRSARDHHINLNNSPTTGQNSVNGQSFLFNSSNNEYLDTNEEVSNWYQGNNISAFCWIKTTSDGVVFGVRGGGHVPALLVKSEGDFGASLVWHGNTSWVVSNSTVNDGNWHHVGGVYENGTERVYVDGVEENTRTGLNQQDFGNGNYTYEVGADTKSVWGSGNTQYFDGNISDFRVYNRALSQSEVNQLYNFRGSSRKSQTTVVAEDSLQAWYPFLQSGAADKSGNGNDGTVNGPTYNESGGPNGLGAYGFDGNDDSIKVDNVPTNQTSEVTISAWVYITGNAGNSWERHVDLQDGNNGKLVVLRWDDDGSQYGFQALGADADVNQDPPQNVWLHWVGVIRNGTAYLYENAVEKATSSTGGSSTDSSFSLGIGNRYDGGGDHVLANMTDVRVYDKALSQSEINQLYDPKSVNLDRGLVGHWSMDDSDVSGGTLYDRSAYDNHGNISGPTTGRSSIIGNSFEFDGTDDTVIIGTDSTLQNQKITAVGWAKADSWSSRDEVFNWDGGGFHVATVNSGVPRFWLNLDGSWDYVDGPSSISTNTWHMFTGTWDGNEQAIWLNGEKLNSRTDRSGTIPYPTSGDRLSIGAYDSNSNVFDGLISNVRLYKRKLTEKEINALYNKRTTSSVKIN